MAGQQQERVFIHNVLMAGPTHAGKSLLVDTFLAQAQAHAPAPPPVAPVYVPTMDGRFLSRTVRVNSRPVTINICDLSGDPFYSLINHSNGRTFPSTAAAILAYDVTDSRAFEKLEEVIRLYEPFGIGKKHVPTLLIGNKTDLVSERKISYQEGKAFAVAKELTLIETSALTGYNVEYAFIHLACMALRSMGLL